MFDQDEINPIDNGQAGEPIQEPSPEPTPETEPAEQAAESTEQSSSEYHYKPSAPSEPEFDPPKYAEPPRFTPPPQYNYSWQGGQIPKPPKKNTGLKAFIIAATACLLVVVVLLTVVLLDRSSSYQNGSKQDISDAKPAIDVSKEAESQQEVSYEEFIKKSESSSELDYTYAGLFNKCSQSCVSVLTDSALGSGFVIDTDGHILTNHHVIEDAKSIKVQFYDGTEYTAELIGSDSASDIAVLKITASDLVPMEIGDSDSVIVGEEVVAIGTPYDISLAGTITPGIISGIARDVKITNDYGTVVKTMTLLQTSAAINPGNSGGPLINSKGQVIGITSLKLINEYENLGFAIPINNAVTIANIILTYGKVTERPDDDIATVTAKLNITVCNIDAAVSYGYLTDSEDIPEGSFVMEVSRQSSIYKAGLELYDIITEFDGVRVKTKEALTTELAKHSAGETVTIKVYRINRDGNGGTEISMTFKLDSAS